MPNLAPGRYRVTNWTSPQVPVRGSAPAEIVVETGEMTEVTAPSNRWPG